MGALGAIGERDLQQVTSAEISAELERVLNSQTFRNAKAPQNFLRYVVERTLAGEAKQIKEIAIGIDVFRRGTPFDPRLDNIVRVEARKLRQRLGKYYETEGLENPVRIDLPQGGYVPAFRSTVDTVLQPEMEQASSQAGFKEIAETISAPVQVSDNGLTPNHRARFISRRTFAIAAIIADLRSDPRFGKLLAQMNLQ